MSDPHHIWIAGNSARKSILFRYDANQQPKNVESDGSYFYRSGYGLHYTLNPNPANESTVLQLHEALLPKTVSAFNMLGIETILHTHIDGSRAKIDTRSLPVGHSTLRVRHSWGFSCIPPVVMQ